MLLWSSDSQHGGFFSVVSSMHSVPKTDSSMFALQWAIWRTAEPFLDQTMCRYYEGQLSDLIESDSEAPPSRDRKLVTEAAAQVNLLISLFTMCFCHYIPVDMQSSFSSLKSI